MLGLPISVGTYLVIIGASMESHDQVERMNAQNVENDCRQHQRQYVEDDRSAISHSHSHSHGSSHYHTNDNDNLSFRPATAPSLFLASKGEPVADYEIDSPNDLNPFRRSSSLKIQKTNVSASSTPAQKKMVRFADVLGLDLTSVRMFLDELPTPPPQPPIVVLPKLASAAIVALESRALVPTFVSPVELTDFADRIQSRHVCLETACVGETPVRHIAGRIKVSNLDYCKSVYVRYTTDEWKTYAEMRATYVPPEPDHDHDHRFDRFTFVIYIYDTLSVSDRIEFAIRYHCRDSVYWDNNDGNNYAFRRASAADNAAAAIHSPPIPTCTVNYIHYAFC